MRLLTLFILLAVLSTGTCLNPFAMGWSQAPSAESAREVAERIHAAHGGNAWPVDRLAYTFTVTRDGSSTSWAHEWWPKRNRCVVTGPYRDGRTFMGDFDTETLQGTFTIDDLPVEGDEVIQVRDVAHGRWINDSYWLLMPIKLLDPGVKLELLSSNTLRLSFEKVGLTPSDVYDVVFDPATHRIVSWTYFPRGDMSSPKVFGWEDPRQVGPLLLPTKRTLDGAVFISFDGLEVDA